MRTSLITTWDRAQVIGRLFLLGSSWYSIRKTLYNFPYCLDSGVTWRQTSYKCPTGDTLKWFSLKRTEINWILTYRVKKTHNIILVMNSFVSMKNVMYQLFLSWLFWQTKNFVCSLNFNLSIMNFLSLNFDKISPLKRKTQIHKNTY